MKTVAATAALIAFATPVLADPASVIAHFNQDLSPNAQIVLPETGQAPVTVSTRSGRTGDVIAHFNQSAERNSDRIVSDSATVVSGTPAYGADIFAIIRAEDD